MFQRGNWEAYFGPIIVDILTASDHVWIRAFVACVAEIGYMQFYCIPSRAACFSEGALSVTIAGNCNGELYSFITDSARS